MNLSAAGMSNFVRSTSTWRRLIWSAVLLTAFGSMIYMTYRVVVEYRRYPAVMVSSVISKTVLEFPAVTVCGLNLVPANNAKEAGLTYLQEMQDLLESLPTYNLSVAHRMECLSDPLCQWSQFDDRCKCSDNPCDTPNCFKIDDTSDGCYCTTRICSWEKTSKICSQENQDFCFCNGSANFEEPGGKDNKQGEFDSSIDIKNISLASEKILDLLKHIQQSRTDDLRDVVKMFRPSLQVVDNFGFSYEDLVLSCSYGKLPCSSEDFKALYSPNFGKCYMFNYVGDSTIKPKTIVHAGRSTGLQLYLQSRREDTLPLLNRVLGIRLVVHDPRTLPYASEGGFDVRPGDTASVAINSIEVHRLGSPWSTCAPPSNYPGEPYHQLGCQRHCVNELINKTCGCLHPRLLSNTAAPRSVQICNETQHLCYSKIFFDSDGGKLNCDCPFACKEKLYDISISAGSLNPDFFRLVKQAKSLRMIDGEPKVVNVSEESFDLMGVLIYMTSLSINYQNETAIYSWESLVANIGGNMGLFLGLSIVTFVEIFEFLGRIMAKLFIRMGL